MWTRKIRATAFLTLILFLSDTVLFANGTAPTALPKQLVICIQENHSDPEAQKKISEIIQYFQKKLGAQLLAVEGAAGEIPADELRKYPATRAKKDSSGFLVDQLILDGASHAAIFAAKPLRFVGIEDPALYQSNLESFRQVKKQTAASEKFLQERKSALDKELKQIQSEDLRRLETSEDIRFLIELADKDAIETDDLVQIRILERLMRGVGAGLVPARGRAQGPPLQVDFLLDHPEIRRTLEQAELKKLLSAHLLMEELTILKQRLKSVLIKTDFERQFDRKKTEYERLEKILNLKATREDSGFGIQDPVPGVKEAAEFYRLARMRDAALAENFLKALGRSKSAILVSGGFHTQGITDILKRRGISCIVVAPRPGESHPNEALYERRLAGDFEVATLAAPRVLANPAFRNRLLHLWRKLETKGDLSESAIAQAYLETQTAGGQSLGEHMPRPFKPATESNVWKQIYVDVTYRLKSALRFVEIIIEWFWQTFTKRAPTNETKQFLKSQQMLSRMLQDKIYRAAEKDRPQLQQILNYISEMKPLPGNFVELRYFMNQIAKGAAPLFLGTPNLENLDYIVLDTETTGFLRTGGRLLEVTAIRYRGLKEIDRFSMLVRPEKDIWIPWLIRILTGITPKILESEKAPPAAAAIPRLAEFLAKHPQAILVVHNPEFDMPLVKSEFEQLKIEGFYYDIVESLPDALDMIGRQYREKNSRVVLDTLAMARSVFPESPKNKFWLYRMMGNLGWNTPSYIERHAKYPPVMPNRRLGTLLAYFGVKTKLHRSAQDAVADKIVFLALASMMIKRENLGTKKNLKAPVENREEALTLLKAMYPIGGLPWKKQGGVFAATEPEEIMTVLGKVKISPGIRVLDIGSGDGRIGIAAALLGAEAAIVESDPWFSDVIQRQLEQFWDRTKRPDLAYLEKKDIAKENFRHYDVIFYSAGASAKEAQLEEKILHDVKPGTKIVVFSRSKMAEPHFKNLILETSENEDRVQIYTIPFTTIARVGSELWKNDWMNAWDQKLRWGVISYLPRSGKIEKKSFGPFSVLLLPKRNLSKRRFIRDFRDVPDQHVFQISLAGRRYLLGVNRYPAMSGQGLIYEDLSSTDTPSPQAMTAERLEDLLAFKIRYPYFSIYFNGGEKAGASVPVFHAHLIVDVKLPVEDWKREKRSVSNRVTLSKLRNYPATAVVLDGGSFRERAQFASQFLDLAHQHQIPYNLLIGYQGTIYLFFRNPATSRIDLGSLEHAGIFLASSPEAYKLWNSEQTLRNELASVALKEADFQSVLSAASASSLGKKIKKILIIGDSGARAQLKKHLETVGILMDEKREFEIHEIEGKADKIAGEVRQAQAQGKPFDLVISFLKTGRWWGYTTADKVFEPMRTQGVPFLALNTSEDRKDKSNYPVIGILHELSRQKAEGFLGLLDFSAGNDFLHFMRDGVIGHLERKYELQELKKKKEAEDEERLKKKREADAVEAERQRLVKIAAEELAKRQAAEAKAKEEAAARKAAEEAQIAKEKADAEAKAAASQAEQARAAAEKAAIQKLEEPDKTPPPGYPDDVYFEAAAPSEPDPKREARQSDGPPAASGESYGSAAASSLGLFRKVSLARKNRVESWFGRSERLRDEVVFLVRKQTLLELTGPEKEEINFHLRQKNRKLMILRERNDQDLNLYGLEGRVRHWWGSAEDYLQVLRRQGHPHVIYLSGENEAAHFAVPEALNVKHSLYAPTAAIEYLFQGRLDLYGIWKKESGRLVLSLNDRLIILFQEVAAERWARVSA